MADIAIKMGVDGPGNEVNRVLRVFEIVDESDAPEEAPFVLGAYEEDFSDSAIGLLSSMSVILSYTGADGKEKTFTEHVLQAFERYTEEDGGGRLSDSHLTNRQEAHSLRLRTPRPRKRRGGA